MKIERCVAYTHVGQGGCEAAPGRIEPVVSV